MGKKTHPMLVPHSSDDDDDYVFSLSDAERQNKEDDEEWAREVIPRDTPNVWLEEKDMAMFGAAPMQERPDVRTCNTCGKPILASAVKVHVENCKKIQALPATESAKGKGKKAEPAKPKGTPAKRGVKRKAADDDEDEEGEPPKKRAKKPAAPKKAAGAGKGRGKVKGPVDVDTQCGVINNKGLQCSRALTCKSHTVGSKRSVPGRSKPWDDLLLDWNRLHKANFKEPPPKTSKEEKKLIKAREREEKRLEREREKELKGEAKAAALAEKAKAKNTPVKAPGGKKKGTAAQRAAAAAAEAAEAEAERQLDSEEELEALITVTKTLKNRARPAAQPTGATNFFLVRNANYAAYRDEIADALGVGHILNPQYQHPPPAALPSLTHSMLQLHNVPPHLQNAPHMMMPNRARAR